jgi:hypothetical protein
VQDGTTFGTETHVDEAGASFTSVSFCEGYIDRTFLTCSAVPTAAPDDSSAAWTLASLLVFWNA